jgi:hypothetical protein
MHEDLGYKVMGDKHQEQWEPVYDRYPLAVELFAPAELAVRTAIDSPRRTRHCASVSGNFKH